MDLQQVRDGIAQNLAAIAGLRVFGYWPDSAPVPAAVIGFPEEWRFDKTMGRGLDEARAIPVIIIVGKASDRASQQLLASYCTASGDTSVKAAVEEDKTLAGSVDDCRVTRAYGFGNYTLGANDVLGFKVDVHVIG